MPRCIFCGAIDTIAPITTPDGDEYILMSKSSDGNFSLPPNGIVIKAMGCTKCGSISLGSPALIGMPLSK